MDDFPITRRRLLGAAGLAAGAAALPGCAEKVIPVPTVADDSTLLDSLAWRLLETDPELATTLGVDSGGHAHLRSRLKDRSPAGMANIACVLRKDSALIAAVLERPVPPALRNSLSVVQSAYRTALDGLALPYGDATVGSWRNAPYVVIQNVGAYLDTQRFLDGDHQIGSAEDGETWLARFAQMPAQLDGELERLASAGAMGVAAPAFLLDTTIAQMRQSIAEAENGGEMVQSLVRRTRHYPGDWERRARTISKETIAPALRRQLAELLAQRARATGDAGLWARPHGDAWYAWALRASTTTHHAPADIHQMGLSQVADLHDRMDPILRRMGYSSGTVGERMTALASDPRYQFTNDDKGRAAIIALVQASIDRIRTRLPDAFRKLVPGRLEIRRLPLAEEAGAPAAYGGPGSIDGSVPGKIWLNLGDTSRHSHYSVPDLTFHEGIPGHVWQGEYANRMPLIRSMLAFNAYTEGWALYAEQLADELGAYDGDEAGRLGYLQSLAFRACRMVVDTGLHAKRWSREQAVHWFMTTNGSGRIEVASEVDRYCSWPGQACGYKMGHSEIVALREKAQRQLGGRFDLRDFNQAVLDGGNVPLDVLGQTVSEYVRLTQ